ncbi:NAD-dependent epimerase/dehydratase family protein [Cohnella nanjingensis]|uniref:NAD(P)-dependent oxidoreductase n=1 Tax=Cohnella nanjingensis TaxID=1387779 RepID=A0A7X0S0D5_9BACL|nr:NAD(P)-dependent oxidoreductase [Cohnella nanjingensis]MBB6675630.1 NAD(P)-dependent oxidoreductase [Cohnella nanjingensis]
MKTIAVTGGSGKLGRQVVAALLDRQYQVVSLDQRRADLPCRQLQVDLSDFGQVAGALQDADAVVHLAAIPSPNGFPYAAIFANNALSTYHILEAASQLGIRKVVSGSSESSYGFAWSPAPLSPDYFPIDEEHPQRPAECYGLSKVVNELTGEMFHRRTGMQVVSMRYSTIMTQQEFARMDAVNPNRYEKSMWSYIDIRDAARATVAALEAEGLGAVSLNVTSDDTLSELDTEDLLRICYPDVQARKTRLTGRTAVVSNRLAKEKLGWQPLYSWKGN